MVFYNEEYERYFYLYKEKLGWKLSLLKRRFKWDSEPKSYFESAICERIDGLVAFKELMKIITESQSNTEIVVTALQQNNHLNYKLKDLRDEVTGLGTDIEMEKTKRDTLRSLREEKSKEYLMIQSLNFGCIKSLPNNLKEINEFREDYEKRLKKELVNIKQFAEISKKIPNPCPICQEKTVNRTLNPCGHTFCQDCLLILTKNPKFTYPGTLICPTCKRVDVNIIHLYLT